jgi:hypothetical protein
MFIQRCERPNSTVSEEQSFSNVTVGGEFTLFHLSAQPSVE